MPKMKATTKRSSVRIIQKFIFSAAAFLLFAQLPLRADDVSSTSVLPSDKRDSWVVAARKFDLPKYSDYSKSAQAASSVIPKLILEQISSDTTRSVLHGEHVRRQTDTLLTERLDLFLQLGKEIKARDALILNNYTTFEYEKALKAQQKKIDDIQKKIDRNLEKQELVLHPDGGKKSEAKQVKKAMEPSTEKISLYQNDSEKLFEATAEAEEAGVASRKYEKEMVAAKIAGLISGSIVIYGQYLSVTAELYVYPGVEKVHSVMEVGSLSDIRRISENLAFELLPKIANGLPVEIEFEINPPESAEKTVLTIDNIVYNPAPKKAVVSSGFHSVSLECKDYARESFLYNFSGRKRFSVEVNFKEKSDGAVTLSLSKFVPGNLFYGGDFISQTQPGVSQEVPIRVNGGTAFGYFEGTVKDKDAPDGQRKETMFLMIPSNLMADGNQLEQSVKVFDVAKNIDHRRRMMYVSYSALLISLPFMFYTYGKFMSFQNAWNSYYGNVDFDEYDKFRRLSLYGTAITAACGVWFAAELVAYLVAVDKTLPSRAKKVRQSTLQRMQNERLGEAQRKMMEDEAAALVPLMKNISVEKEEAEGDDVLEGPKEKDSGGKK